MRDRRRALPRRATLAAAALLLLGAPGPASAAPRVEMAEVDLEALLDLDVAAVTLHDEPASRAPATTFVLSGDDLRRMGARTLHDALRFVPGLFGYADGLYPSIGVRGVGLLADYTTRVLVLVDGHPLNNTVAIGQSYVGRDLPVPVEAIRRVEVIEGPVSSVYGPTAFFAVVNVVTREPGTAGLDVAAFAEGVQGAVRGGEGALAFGGADGGLRVAASAGGAGTTGQAWTFPELAADPSRPGSPARVAGVDRSGAGQAYLRLAAGPLELRAACGVAGRRIPSAPYQSLVGDPRNAQENRSCFGEFVAAGAPVPDVAVEGRASFDLYRFDDWYAYPDGVFRDRGEDRWAAAELRADWAPRPEVRLAGGGRVEAHWTSQRSAFLSDRTTLAIEKDFSTINLYAIAEREVGAARLHGGLTFFHHPLFGDRLTPKLAATLRVGAADTAKLIFSRGFRPPTLGEAFFDDGTDFLANPALRPEIATSAEASWERRGAGWRLVLGAFWNRFDDLIRFVTVPAPGVANPDPGNPADFRQQAVNSGRFEALGLQASLALRLGDRLEGWVGGSTQGTRRDRPVNFAAWTASASLTTRWPWRPLSLTASAAVLSGRRKDPGALAPGARTTVPPAALATLAAGLDVPAVPGLQALASIRGLSPGRRLAHPVAGDFTPISELAEPAPTFVLGLRLSR